MINHSLLSLKAFSPISLSVRSYTLTTRICFQLHALLCQGNAVFNVEVVDQLADACLFNPIVSITFRKFGDVKGC